MLDCFDGLVTLDNTCEGGVSSFPLQMHGVNQTLIGRFTGPEDTWRSVLANCEAWARAVMANDAPAYMSAQAIAKTIMNGYSVGEPDEDQEVMTATGIGGFMVEIGVPSSNLVLTIGSLGLYAQQTGDVTITVYDLADGTVAATYVLAAVADEATVSGVQITLPASKRAKRYFVSHNLGTFYRTNTHEGCGTCSHSHGYGGVYITGARIEAGDPIRRSSIVTQSHSSGLSAVLTVSCDHAQTLCEVKGMLGMAYSLKVAEGVYRWGIKAVDRMNNSTVDRDALAKEAARLDNEYRSQMQTVLGRLGPPADRLCFACATPTRTYNALP